MPEDITTPQDGPPSGTPTPAPATPPSADASHEDRRYAGLQTYYDRALSERGYRKVTDIPHAQAMSEWKNASDALPALQATLEQFKARATEADTLQSQLTLAQSQLAKTRLILEVDPALLHLADTIPTAADGDAQRAAIQSFRDNLVKAGYTVTGAPRGPLAPPASPPVSAPNDEATNLEEYKALLRKGLYGEADVLLNQFYKT